MFINQTIEFYQKASKNLQKASKHKNDAEMYVTKVNQYLLNEHDRAERYLDRATERRLIEVL